MTKLTALDWIVIGVYFLILLAIVVVEMRRRPITFSPAATPASS